MNSSKRVFKCIAEIFRTNYTPYMNRTLRKAIMKRCELERKYLKNRTNENRIRYKKQKKERKKVLFKQRIKIFYKQ